MPLLLDKHVALLCHLDRLWHLDDANWVYFSLNVAPTFANADKNDAALAGEEHWIYCWRHAIDAIRLSPIDPVVQKPSLTDVEILPHSANPPAQLITDVETSISTMNWRWNPPNAAGAANNIEMIDINPAAKPLRAFLMSTGTSNQPVPQLLNLSRIFRVKTTWFNTLAPGTKLVAAPVLSDAITQTDPVLQGSFWTWSYETPPTVPAPSVPVAATPLNLMAYIEPAANVAAPATATASLIRLSDYWIGSVDPRPDQMLSTIEADVANFLDLGQRMIDALRANLTAIGFCESLAELPISPITTLRDAILAALRDSAGLGLWKLPDGGHLSNDAFAWALANPGAIAVYENTTIDPDHWRAILAQAIPELAASKTLGMKELVLAPHEIRSVIDELDRLQSALADDVILRRVILAQWREVLAGNGTKLADIAADLDQAAVRRRMLSGSLNVAWQRITKDLPAPNFTQIGKDYLNERFLPRSNVGTVPLPKAIEEFGWLQRRPYVPWTSLPALVRTSFEASFEGVVNDLSTKLMERIAPPPLTNAEHTEKPHPIVLQVDRLGNPAADSEDFLRSLAGVGILMRENAAGKPWRCLNTALVKVGNSQGPLVDAETLVPLRLQYRNGLPEVFIPYDNQPLAANSPLQSLPAAVKDDSKTAIGNHFVPLLHFAQASGEWSKLPALRFGKSYQFAVFAIGNSGALPKSLADPSDPKRLKGHTDFNQSPGIPNTLNDNAIREVTYRRRVGVGKVRIQQGQNDTANALREINVPAIPDRVYPLARELKLVADSTTFLLLHSGNGNSSALPQSVSFHLRKPATDLNSWDRWHSAFPLVDRKTVWTEFYRRQAGNIHPTQTLRDSTIDDPAVADFAVLRLKLLTTAGAVATSYHVDYPPATAAPDSFNSLVQRPAREIKIQGVPGIATPAFDTSTSAISIPEGEICEVSFLSAVASSEFTGPSARFEGFTPAELIDDATIGPNFKLVSEARMIVEVAKKVPITGDIVWNALSPALQGSRILVSLDTSDPAFRYVKGLELNRQLWRWDGRPLPRQPFPYGDNLNSLTVAGSPPPSILNWEAQTMGERPDSDMLRVPKMLTTDQANTAGSVFLIYEEDISRDSRAMYFRFSLIVRNRYEGIFTTDQDLRPVQSRVSWASSPGVAAHTDWKRLFVPCRNAATPERPLIKIVVPLTETDAATSVNHTPAILVVLNEPWFEQAGLAETFKSEIVMIPAHGTWPATPEIGPDPVFIKDGFSGILPANCIQQEGPVGFTFDLNSSAPLWTSSAFILRLTNFATSTTGYMARLKFRRSFEPAAALAPPIIPSGSDYTASQWIQFLADSRDFGAGITVDKWRLSVDSVAGTIMFLSPAGQALSPEASPRDATLQNVLQLWVVVTQRITDALGRQDQERFLGIFVQDPNDKTLFKPDAGFSGSLPKDGIRARLLEVQLNLLEAAEQFPLNAPKLDLLFQEERDGGSRELSDAYARVIRLSPPVE